MAVTRHLVGLGIPVLALDYDAKRVRDSQAHGLPVYFGNAARADVLRAAHVARHAWSSWRCRAPPAASAWSA